MWENSIDPKIEKQPGGVSCSELLNSPSSCLCLAQASSHTPTSPLPVVIRLLYLINHHGNSIGPTSCPCLPFSLVVSHTLGYYASILFHHTYSVLDLMGCDMLLIHNHCYLDCVAAGCVAGVIACTIVCQCVCLCVCVGGRDKSQQLYRHK